jgi:hypothetical protein
MEGKVIIVNTQVVRYRQLAITHPVPWWKNGGEGFKVRDINSNIENKGYWIFWLIISFINQIHFDKWLFRPSLEASFSWDCRSSFIHLWRWRISASQIHGFNKTISGYWIFFFSIWFQIGLSESSCYVTMIAHFNSWFLVLC